MANIKKIKAVPGGLGEATPDQVLAGVTFSSQSGVQQVGTLTSVNPDAVTLMVRTEDGEYPVGNAEEPEQIDENTISLNIN